jgi:hypothetical protein
MRIHKAGQHHSAVTVVNQRSGSQRSLFHIFSGTNRKYLSIRTEHRSVRNNAQIAHISAAQRSFAGGNGSDKLTDVGQEKRAIAN